jgi:isopentenyl-diphosphate Delta-isomerase
MALEYVILVNEKDEPIGKMEKMQAHIEAKLHRAFSVFLMNDKHEMLLQRRALTKYHSGGLLTNACCSHQLPTETNIEAGKRRMQEELGFEVGIEDAFTFLYHAKLNNNLTEHEIDHVLFGICNNAPNIFKIEEVSEIMYQPLDFLLEDILKNKEKYTAWFIIALPMFSQWYYKNIVKN